MSHNLPFLILHYSNPLIQLFSLLGNSGLQSHFMYNAGLIVPAVCMMTQRDRPHTRASERGKYYSVLTGGFFLWGAANKPLPPCGTALRQHPRTPQRGWALGRHLTAYVAGLWCPLPLSWSVGSGSSGVRFSSFLRHVSPLTPKRWTSNRII